MAGNVTSAQVDCCQLKTVSYTDSPNTHTYVYPTLVTSGASSTTTTISATYDFNTGLLATTTDENSQVTTNYYNADSLRPNYVSYPGGGQTNFYYGDGLWADNAGHYHHWNMVSTKFGSGTYDWTDVYRFMDGRGAQAQVFYDGVGSGPWTTQITEYNEMGRAYRTTNPFADGGYGGALTGLWTTASFDHLGRVTGVSMPSGDDSSATTASVSSTYDQVDTTSGSLGLLTTVTDAAGKVRRQKVDALGRVVRLDEPTSSGLGSTSSPNQATSYGYDVLGNLLQIHQDAQDRYFKYDSLSRLILEKQPEQSTAYTTSYSSGNNSWSRKLFYNSSGLVTEADDAAGIKTLPTYDDLNRVTQIEYRKVSDNSLEGTPTAHYYYDSMPSGAPSFPSGYTNHLAGRLAAMTYGSGSTGDYFGYDVSGQVTQQYQVTGSGPTTYGLAYTYNLAGMLTGETYPNGRAMSYSYGYGGKLSSVADGSTTFANTFTYAPNGGLTSENWGNTGVHTMSYNHAQQVSQVKLSINGSEKQRYDYLYGEVTQSSGSVDTTKNTGQIARIDGTINAASTKEWDQRFVHDELGRLNIAAEYKGSDSTKTWQSKYTYDRYGNRLQSGTTDNTGVGFISVVGTDIDAATNRFTSGTSITYDGGSAGNGNITNDGKFRGLTYAYDANGRQKAASNGTWTETQTYDAAGQRVQTSVGTSYRTMVYDIFGQDVADYSGSTGGTLERENIYRGGLLATCEGTSIKYVLQDAQGSTRVITDNNGGSSIVVARHDYLPFGEEIGSIGSRTTAQKYGDPDTNRQKYGLTERDDTSGLDHTWFRKSESLSRRWTSPDPYLGSVSIGNPQSFNRYSYVQNDPVNYVDPSGLKLCWDIKDHVWFECGDFDSMEPIVTNTSTWGYSSGGNILGGDPNNPFRIVEPGESGGVVGGGIPEKPTLEQRLRSMHAKVDACLNAAFSLYLGREARTLAKQAAANFVMGLAVGGALVFGSEGLAAVEGVTIAEIGLDGLSKVDALGRAAVSVASAVYVGGKYWASLVKESYANKRDYLRGVQRCHSDNPPR